MSNLGFELWWAGGGPLRERSQSRFPSSSGRHSVVKIEWGSAPASTWQGGSSIMELFFGGFLAACYVVPPNEMAVG
jgi:hypothetical protein